jgi:hypothetical protein
MLGFCPTEVVMHSLRIIILLGTFLFSGLSGFAEDDKEEFTLVNKEDLAERKKTWQKAVRDKAILTKENEKMTAAMATHSNEIERMKINLEAASEQVKKYRKLVNLLVYQQPRIWTSNAGKALQAILIQDDGESVRLKTDPKSEVSISRNGLSKRDIDFLDELRKVEDAAGSVSDEDQFQKAIEESLDTVL